MKSGDLITGVEPRDSANRCLALKHSATVACIRSDDTGIYRLVYQRRTRRTGFDSRSQNPEMKISPDFIIIVMSSWKTQLRVSCAFHVAFYSLCLHRLLWVTVVERPSSWSYVVLPCWLTERHPSHSELELPINGGVPRLFLYSMGSPFILPCRMHTLSIRTKDCDEIRLDLIHATVAE